MQKCLVPAIISPVVDSWSYFITVIKLRNNYTDEIHSRANLMSDAVLTAKPAK